MAIAVSCGMGTFSRELGSGNRLSFYMSASTALICRWQQRIDPSFPCRIPSPLRFGQTYRFGQSLPSRSEWARMHRANIGTVACMHA